MKIGFNPTPEHELALRIMHLAGGRLHYRHVESASTVFSTGELELGELVTLARGGELPFKAEQRRKRYEARYSYPFGPSAPLNAQEKTISDLVVVGLIELLEPQEGLSLIRIPSRRAMEESDLELTEEGKRVAQRIAEERRVRLCTTRSIIEPMRRGLWSRVFRIRCFRGLEMC